MHAWSSFVPYALAAGCSVVVSPSRQDPVAAEDIARVALEVGWPKGAINLIHGGREINKYILQQAEIQGLGFIGSSHAGWELFKLCGELGKNSSINGNGKNTVVIMPDVDVKNIVPFVRQGCFGMTGQRCLGSDNVMVVGDIYDEFKKGLVEMARNMKLGYGLDESTDMGPYCTAAGREKVAAWIDRGLAAGATMVHGGWGLPPELSKGFFLAPTIIENVHPDMNIAQEEAFGAVAALIRVGSLDEAIHFINSGTDLGHSACIMTESGRHARKFASGSQCGKRWNQRWRAPAVRLLSPRLETQVLLWRGQEQDGLHEALLGRKDGDGPVGMRESAVQSSPTALGCKRFR